MVRAKSESRYVHVVPARETERSNGGPRSEARARLASQSTLGRANDFLSAAGTLWTQVKEVRQPSTEPAARTGANAATQPVHATALAVHQRSSRQVTRLVLRATMGDH